MEKKYKFHFGNQVKVSNVDNFYYGSVGEIEHNVNTYSGPPKYIYNDYVNGTITNTTKLNPDYCESYATDPKFNKMSYGVKLKRNNRIVQFKEEELTNSTTREYRDA